MFELCYEGRLLSHWGLPEFEEHIKNCELCKCIHLKTYYDVISDSLRCANCNLKLIIRTKKNV